MVSAVTRPAVPKPRGARPGVAALGGPSAARAAGAITLGVEEEFVLLDPSDGAAVLAGPDVMRVLGGEPGIKQEVMRFQLETATRVCTSLDDVGRDLTRLRRLAADAAASAGCRLVASGIAPYGAPGLAAVTNQPRYRELARQFGPLVAEAGAVCGCHVHVGVPSRDLGVQVLARLRPWLAPLLAITVNSPIADGRDTAWASCRYPAWSRWPTASAPGTWPDAAAYDAAVRRLIGRGAALDEQGIYLLARLSPRYPTVEVRVADACLDSGTAVLLAGLTRALVATALAEARRGTPVPAAPASWVNAALAAAARHGLAGPAVDPFTGRAADPRSLKSRLVDHVYPALCDRGDVQMITGLLRRLDRNGTGADHQRALFASGASPAGFVQALAHATLSHGVLAPAGHTGLRSRAGFAQRALCWREKARLRSTSMRFGGRPIARAACAPLPADPAPGILLARCLLPGPFAAATAVQPAEAGQWSASIHPGWDIAGNANGGYLLALATRALVGATRRPDPVTVTAHYLSTGQPGRVGITTQILKEGKRFATGTATMFSGSRPLLAVLGTLGDLSQAQGPELVEGAPPELPPPEQCTRLHSAGTFPPPFMDKVDLRLHPDDAAFATGRQSGRPLMRGWFRLPGAEHVDSLALLCAVDAFPPTAFNARLPVGWTPTVELTAHIRANPAAGWLRCRFTTRFVTAGFLEEDGEVWDSTGRLVGQSRQLALVPRRR